MQSYQRDFLDFALDVGVLRFGEFTLKSGRISLLLQRRPVQQWRQPGSTGEILRPAIVNSGIRFDVLYGPAYKGIPLAAVTAAALYDHHGIDIPYAFNRKEAKDHGEGGSIVGHPLEGRIMIIDDVITAGTAIRESMDIINAQGATPAGVVIALDRQERGTGERSAIQEVENDYRMPVAAIVRLEHLVEYLAEMPDAEESLQQIRAYRDQYGV